MTKLSEEDKKHFILTAKQAPLGDDGRVFVGTRGLNGKSLREYLGELLYPNSTSSDRTFVGSGGCDYYLRREKWIKLFGAGNYPMKTAAKKVAAKKVVKKKVATTNKDVRISVTRTLAQAYAAAKAAEGEKIVLSDGKVATLSDKVYVSFSFKDIEREINTDQFLPVDLAIAKKILADGVPVIWNYSYGNGTYRFVGFNGEFGEFKPASKPIVVNGETGEEKDDYWKFGCANIAKADLRQARKFIFESSTYFKSKHANRKIEGVMIGKGFFTLEILDQMNLGA